MKGFIYKIINLTNGNFYIGSTLNPKKRKTCHFRALKEGRHHSLFLQRAYDCYGEKCFEFKIIKEKEFSNEKELRNLEERYINFCWKSGKLYNVSKKGSGGDLVSYNPRLDEIKEKQRIASLKIWENKSEEEKKAYSEKMKGSGNPNFGNRWNEEQRQRASKRLREYYKTHEPIIPKGTTLEEAWGKEKADKVKKMFSDYAKERKGEKNPFYNKRHTEETKKKLSEKRKGQLPTNSKKVSYNGVIYESATICAKELNLKHVTVCYRCRKEIMGFKFV